MGRQDRTVQQCTSDLFIRRIAVADRVLFSVVDDRPPPAVSSKIRLHFYVGAEYSGEWHF
jgi:hypothetical protein